MPPRPKENVWNYPRPPALQPTSARLRVIWVTPSKQELVVAETTQGYRVLETSHPPTYYFPPSSVKMDLIKPSKTRRTMCEWKGMAAYYDLQFSKDQGPVVAGRIWSYPQPTPGFASIKDYLCFYASSQSDPERLGQWKCMVDDDEVKAQEGDFYGSWITPEITGGDRGFKGAPEQAASTSALERDPLAAYKGLTFAETLEDLSSRFIVNLPADELSSIERICFQVEQAHWFYEDFLRPLNASLPSLALRRFSSYLLHTASMIVPLIQRYITGGSGQQDLEAAFDEFLKYKTRVPVCGAILLAEDWNKCLLVKGWKSSAAWGFPKGKINQNEPERDCAIREVLEETGYDCSALLPEGSEDYLDLTMREQRLRLYIVPGVKENTKFETLTRKEISKIAWFKLSDLPTWKKSKDPPAGMGGKFYLISPFIGRLKQWIANNKANHSQRPTGKSEPIIDSGYAASSPAPSAAKAASAAAMPSFVDTTSLFPTFSGENKTAHNKAEPLPAPPTSDKLKALLGLSSPTPEHARTAIPYAADGQAQANALEQMFSGVGAKMIQASGDERGQQLLSLLMNSNAAPQGKAGGAPNQSEAQDRAALLLSALNRPVQTQGEASSSPAPQNAHPLLSMLNDPARSQSPLPAPIPQKSGQAQKLLQMLGAGMGHDRSVSQSSFASFDNSSPAPSHSAVHQEAPPSNGPQADALLRMLQPSSAPTGPDSQSPSSQAAPKNDLLSILTAGLPSAGRPGPNDGPQPRPNQGYDHAMGGGFHPNAPFGFPPPPPHMMPGGMMHPGGGPGPYPFPMGPMPPAPGQGHAQGPPNGWGFMSPGPHFAPYSTGPPS
ncbi:NUDIX hydrolase domain protein [Kalmanozyma brasiliensis GHG001]|uniref:Nudix hydrolase domain-containing protein n=1 Tax=Kalmanozyma brasiliensis (strain GHG001) TaxID=1365824 RepID=V5EWW0_KALBG|nr:NUDIX hydrolase domain protein [Kalmanozyma brasiliensis GHG001]EST10105.1 NUDIX hydrolase domain protein [Kalmanozyma brasiliensis GHG001]